MSSLGSSGLGLRGDQVLAQAHYGIMCKPGRSKLPKGTARLVLCNLRRRTIQEPDTKLGALGLLLLRPLLSTMGSWHWAAKHISQRTTIAHSPTGRAQWIYPGRYESQQAQPHDLRDRWSIQGPVCRVAVTTGATTCTSLQAFVDGICTPRARARCIKDATGQVAVSWRRSPQAINAWPRDHSRRRFLVFWLFNSPRIWRILDQEPTQNDNSIQYIYVVMPFQWNNHYRRSLTLSFLMRCLALFWVHVIVKEPSREPAIGWQLWRNGKSCILADDRFDIKVKKSFKPGYEA